MTVQDTSIPWDEQIVPALRKKLQAQSNDLSKRISRIQDSETGWSRRISREVVKPHHRESSIDQYHNRFDSVRTPARHKTDHVATSFPFDLPAPSSPSSSEATQRARKKARQIAAKRAVQQQQQQQQNWASADTDGGDGSIDAIAEHGSSLEYRRKRTQSTPMRPSVDLSNQANKEAQPDYASAASTPNHCSHQRTNSLSRRKAGAAAASVPDAQLMAEFGPLGYQPSPSSKLLRAQLDADVSSSSSWTQKQPDAFRSLPVARSMRETSAPPAFGGGGVGTSEFGVDVGGSPASRSVSDWEEQIIPTVARKMQQERFLAQAGGESEEGLIDTWDRNGLPLTKSEVRARRLQQQQQQQKEKEKEEEEDAQMLQSQAGPAAGGGAASNGLSPINGSVERRSTSRASSSRRRSYHSQQQQQVEAVEMQAYTPPPPPSSSSSSSLPPIQQQHQPQQQHSKQSSWDNDKVDKKAAGCCCVVM